MRVLRCSIPVLVLTATTLAQSAPVSIHQPHIDFGKVVRGAVLEQMFTLVNHSDSPLQIAKLRLTPPLLPSHVPAEIPAHKEATLRVKLDTRTLAGPYQGVVLVSFKDPKIAEAELTVTGQVVLPIEAAPPALVVSAERGETKQASITIVNHEPDPVEIQTPVHPSKRFTTKLEAIEPGRSFRLTLVMNPDGPAGKNMETIVLKTNSAAVPELRIPAHTYLRERVYTFPDAIDLGALRLADIRQDPDLLKRTAQTLMIYRKGTSDFQITVSTDVVGLTLTSERGLQGDRYQVTVGLMPDQLRQGRIRGTISVQTNDPQIPKLTIPVSGEIVGPVPNADQ